MLNIKKIAGVDEVGRGCLAGPVFAAAVILNSDINTKGIKDSKKISFKNRMFLSKYIKKNSTFAIAFASVEEIEKLNILNASLLSMKRALDKLRQKPSMIYIDGIFAPKNLKCTPSFRKSSGLTGTFRQMSASAQNSRKVNNLMVKI